MPDYTIIGTESGFSQQPTRQGKMDRFITFQRPDLTLGFATVPEESYTVEAAKQAIIRVEAERRLAQPIKFTIP